MRALLVALATLGCGRAPAPAPAPAPPPDPTCLVEDHRPARPEPDEVHRFRVQLATQRVAPTGPRAPLPGAVVARVEDGALVVRRGGRAILRADARGADEVAWQIERDGVLYLATYFADGAQTYQALQLAAAPRVALAWCRAVPTLGPGTVRGAFATATGPLLVHTPTRLVALDPGTGMERWALPWRDAGAPFTLFAHGAAWIACDREVVAVDRETGRQLWRRDFGGEAVTACHPAGDRVVYAWRTCAAAPCVPGDTGALDAATGEIAWRSASTQLGAPLVALDGDRALVAVPDGVAILDGRTGELGAHLRLPDVPFAAERLPDGDLLLHGIETQRIASDPLTVKWHVPLRSVERRAGHLLAAEAEAATGSSWLVEIEETTGATRRIQLEHAPSRAQIPYELASATILGATADEVEVATAFGFLD